MDEQENNKLGIKLDGSFGAGPSAELVIVTKDPNTGEDVNTTYVIPYLLLDQKKIQLFSDFNLILGYSLIKRERPNEELRNLGL